MSDDKQFNLSELMQKAQEMQKKLQDVQKQMVAIEMVGHAGGDAVSITMTGNHAVKRVHLSVGVLNEEKSVMEDLIAAAINDVVSKIEKYMRDKVSTLAGVELPTDLG